MPNNAAIYIRVSSEEQAVEGYSLAAQERVLREYCKQNKYVVYDTYADEGISAKDIKHRPQMIKMLNDSKKDLFDIILVWKLTRFSRNWGELGTICENLIKNDVYLVSASESFDLTTPSGRAMLGMLGVMAQFEREVIAENVCLGLAERAKQGKRTTNFVLGYDIAGKDSLTINQTESEYVKFAFSEYIKRKNLSEVAEIARKKGYKGKCGKIPTAWSIRKIITRPIYAGYNCWHGGTIKGNHKPIVSVDDYNRVQTLLGQQGKLYGRKNTHMIKKIKAED